MVEDLNAGLAVSVRVELGVVLLKILTPAIHFFFSSFFLIYFQFDDVVVLICSKLSLSTIINSFKCPNGSCHLSL